MPTSLKVIATIGLPASGKSTWAREQALADPSFVLVSKDELRAMVFGDGAVPWSPENEHLIESIRDRIVEEALKFGRSVIVHDTNLARIHLRFLEAIAGIHGAEFETKSFLHVPVETCIERNKLRGDKMVPESVIRNMRTKFGEWWESA